LELIDEGSHAVAGRIEVSLMRGRSVIDVTSALRVFGATMVWA